MLNTLLTFDVTYQFIDSCREPTESGFLLNCAPLREAVRVVTAIRGKGKCFMQADYDRLNLKRVTSVSIERNGEIREIYFHNDMTDASTRRVARLLGCQVR